MVSGATTRRGMVALAAAAAVVGGCGEDGPKRDAAGAIEQAGDTRLLNLRVGDCVSNLGERLRNPDGGHNGVPNVTAVNCSAEHDAEVLRIAPLGGGEWPGFQIVDGDGARGRAELQPRLVRIKRTAGPLRIVSFRPTQPRWDFEDQHEILFIALFEEPRRGHAPK
jgi:hypothetical protein